MASSIISRNVSVIVDLNKGSNDEGKPQSQLNPAYSHLVYENKVLDPLEFGRDP